jgi:hypothetical protein
MELISCWLVCVLLGNSTTGNQYEVFESSLRILESVQYTDVILRREIAVILITVAEYSKAKTCVWNSLFFKEV